MSTPRPGAGLAPEDLLSISYPAGFYRQMSPLHLNYVCTLNGMEAPDRESGFTYCELGCGSGATTAILAAADARGRYYGVDYAAAEIEEARALARDGGLENVEFVCADLLTYDAAELPDFDYITMHGVYSWVPAEVAQAIRRFVARKLKPGGIVYVSYNSLPGWSSTMPLRHYFLEAAKRLDGDLHEKTRLIVAELAHLMENDAVYFAEHPLARRVCAALIGADTRYVAHEYLVGTWRPSYFSTVNREFNDAGVHYVGNAMVLENLLELSMPRRFVPSIKSIEDAHLRESIRDFAVNRMFRTDVYQRPAAESDEPPRGGMSATRFGFATAPDDVTSEVAIWGKQRVDVKGPLFERLKELLTFRALTLDEIRADRTIAQFPDGMLLQAILILSSSGQLAPFAESGGTPPDVSSGRVVVTSALNRALLAAAGVDDEIPLAAPAAGTGLHVSAVDGLMLRAVGEPDPAAWMWAEMQRRKAKMMSEGKALETAEENLAAIRRALAEFRAQRLPQFAYLGLVASRPSE